MQQTFICYNRGLSQDSDKSNNACRGNEEEKVLLTDHGSRLLYEKYSTELAAEMQRNDSNAHIYVAERRRQNYDDKINEDSCLGQKDLSAQLEGTIWLFRV